MRNSPDGLFYSPTDLSHFIHCKHLCFLNKQAALGLLDRPVTNDRVTEMLQQKGLEFEQGYFTDLEEAGKTIVSIDQKDPEAHAKTLAAIKAGADIIYQARMKMDNWQGWADFLQKVDKPSELGDWSYEVLDTKLSSETKAGTIIQIALYSEIVGSIQGMMPEFMHVMKPDGLVSYRVDDYMAYVRLVKKQFIESMGKELSTYPEPVSHCDICNWWERCNKKRREDDHLSFIAGMGKAQIKEVRTKRINTLEGMATLPMPIAFNPSRGSVETYTKLREQARLQLQVRTEKRPVYELLPLEEGFGFYQLPEPSQFDIFLDLEGDPLVDPAGREYIFGWYNQGTYEIIWAENDVDEKTGFERFIDMATQLKIEHPDLHIYHFGAYETTAFKRLMCKYATRENEMDAFLRSHTFVDLHTIVRQSLRAGVEKYSLKDLEKYHGYLRQMDLRELSGFKVDYEYLLETGKAEEATTDMREAIQKYNEDDCISTQYLHQWLETLRQELLDQGRIIPRPEPVPGDPGDNITQHQERIKPIFDALMQDVPLEQENRTAEQQGKFILAHMLDWYRREAKSFWWEYFRLLKLPEDELFDERNALTGLQFTGETEQVKRSRIETYRFPSQECDIRTGKDILNREGRKAGTITSIDLKNGILKIKKGPSVSDEHPGSIYFLESFSAKDKEAAIIDMAGWIVQHEVDNADPAWRAGRDLLLRKPPRVLGVIEPGAKLLHAAINWAENLHGGVLPIQGPPGTGKSYTAGHMIVHLVKQKKRIGVTALSHKVIANLLNSVCDAAGETGLDIKMLQKISDEQMTSTRWSTSMDSKTVSASTHDYDVIAGTPFMWALPSFTETVDYLFVDEAGQLSLIDTLAISHAAKNLVLLGDPQQLKQPQQGVHPDGTEVSALEHILGKEKTIRAEQGIFLSETYRMHPSVCAFDSEMFYENKLFAVPGLENQRLIGNTRFAGSGLFQVTVPHDGNTNRSDEEVASITGIVNELCSGNVSWVNKDGQHMILTRDDIRIISPYNAQVNALSERLPGIAIGTVDKFQGQEAPVVIYSMATSSAQEAPRGLSFLYSPNRFNVAVSRARAVFILLASPGVFEVDCKSPEQIKLANAFCRFVEVAENKDFQIW